MVRSLRKAITCQRKIASTITDMLGVLCARSKPWILNSHSFSVAHFNRCLQAPLHIADFSISNRQRHHSTAHRIGGSNGGTAYIWHLIRPSGFKRKNSNVKRLLAEPRGEGSWNVAWDARPARWLHRPDSAWLLFGVRGWLAPIGIGTDVNNESVVVAEDNSNGSDDTNSNGIDFNRDSSANFKVTGVLADGRCLFRAIAHGACLRSGEEAPDENRQRELADELRAQVVDELLKRREESEWFIEGDFDAYVERIQQPYAWGGEPELLMASHVLKTMVSVFMIDRTSGNLVNIANYGEEYRKDQVNPINVLFHGYGHYDILETSEQNYQKLNI
ncbi:hypothetical protein JCGZ_01529 [Jatropha curcas]|uniref:Ubiquitin thioesterase OTU n=1 Tax=Jatropha curcas TaxID=180498 RepID=A0A067LL01_JATCU|nr:uncharacterized protein LOC105648266 [Jatropha curcas]KDP45029.1 hypothetical protein JCGZ_01529 [Jatropha curcas]